MKTTPVRGATCLGLRRAAWLVALAVSSHVLAGCQMAAGAREHALCCDCAPLASPPPSEETRGPQTPAEVFRHHYGPGAPGLTDVPHTLVAPPEPELPKDLPDLYLRPTSPGRRSDFYAGGGLSVLPNIGISAHAGYVFCHRPEVEWSVEVEGIWQFLDDKTFVDDGNPEAGDWYQAKVGVLARSTPTDRRHATWRGGFTWFRATGEPNLVEQPGDYFGVYTGVGFETDITPSLSIGPEVSLVVAAGPGPIKDGIVPQVAWRATWRPDCSLHAREPLCPGEVYGGGVIALSPSVGGGFEFGQVFARSRLATWSIEALAAFQDLSTDLWGEGEGSWGQARGGVKATFAPATRGHVTARAGIAWFRQTAATAFVDTPGDYLGGYAGLGYEFDVTRHLTTGPEISVLVGAREGTADFVATPQLLWHVLLRL
jgi:hypothetical protein